MSKYLVAVVILLVAGCSNQQPDLRDFISSIEPIGEPVTAGPLQVVNVTGRVLAQCIDGPKTDAEFIGWLRTLPPDVVGLVGYVDDNGDAQVLTQQMLTQP